MLAPATPRLGPATVAEKVVTQGNPDPKEEGPGGGIGPVARPADDAWGQTMAQLAAMRGRGHRPKAQ